MSEEDFEYEEIGHWHRQKVLVVGEQAVVTGNITMSGDYESRFPLQTISNNVHQGTTRSVAFHQYVGVMFATIAVAVIYHAVPGTTVFRFWGGFLTFLPCAFLVASLATVRRFKYAAFTNDAGSVLFSVSQLGPQRQDFDAFIVALRRRVEQSRESRSGPAPRDAVPNEKID